MSKKQKEHIQEYVKNTIIANNEPQANRVERRGRPRTMDPSTTRTDYMRNYTKNYYHEHKTKQKLKQQSYYFKKSKEMPREMIDKYGELASTMFSINQLISIVKENNPEFIKDINLE